MRRKQDKRAKLLVGIIGKEDEARFTAAINRCCTAVNFSGVGHGTARSSYMSYFGFNDIEKRVVFSIIPGALERQILSAIDRDLRLYLVGKGVAFTAPLSGISSIVEEAVLSSPDRQDSQSAKNSNTKKEKETMHELVIAVVNQKYTDAAIDAARAAGATGATLFHTKSINNAKIEERMGTPLPEQTDSIFFLTTEEFKVKIMEAIRDVAGLKTEGGAILFSMPVDEIIGIGRYAQDSTEEQ